MSNSLTFVNSAGMTIGLANTSTGTYNPDGTLNWSGIWQGLGSAAVTTADTIGKASPLGGVAFGGWGMWNSGTEIYGSWSSGQWGKASDLISFTGSALGTALSLAKTTSPAGWAIAGFGLVAGEFGVRTIETRADAIAATEGTANSQETRSLLSRYPGFADIRPTMPADQDPRRLDNTTSSQASQSSTYTGGLAFAQDTAARTAAAQAALSPAPTDPTLGGLRDYLGPLPAVETYTSSSSYTPPAPTDSTESNMCRASDYSGTSSETPIVIDLNGDGVQLNPLGTSHASFDFDNDGYREATAWASAQDGILVIDEGGDGLVTQAKEIAFSQWTAATGDTDLQALAATFDSNHDGVLDANDARFSDFKVWRDANGDGVSDAGEMQTLTQAGIQSMNLTVKSGTDAMLTDGTQVFGLTDVQRTDGSIVQAADVAFAYNKAGYRTRTDSGGNTVYEFESGTTLNYRNIAATATGAAANFNQDTDADANQIAIKKIAVCAVMTGVESRFGIDMVANAQIFWRVA